MTKLRKFNRSLPFVASLFELPIVSTYVNVTKRAGKLYKCEGGYSIWLTPYNQLIFNLTKSQQYQGTYITQLQKSVSPIPQFFTYHNTDYSTREVGNGLIAIEYQCDLVSKFETE
jgi:hypothetical protein